MLKVCKGMHHLSVGEATQTETDPGSGRSRLLFQMSKHCAHCTLSCSGMQQVIGCALDLNNAKTLTVSSHIQQRLKLHTSV